MQCVYSRTFCYCKHVVLRKIISKFTAILYAQLYSVNTLNQRARRFSLTLKEYFFFFFFFLPQEFFYWRPRFSPPEILQYFSLQHPLQHLKLGQKLESIQFLTIPRLFLTPGSRSPSWVLQYLAGCRELNPSYCDHSRCATNELHTFFNHFLICDVKH